MLERLSGFDCSPIEFHANVTVLNPLSFLRLNRPALNRRSSERRLLFLIKFAQFRTADSIRISNAVTHGFDRSSSWNFHAFLPRAMINLRFLSGLAFRVKLCPFPLARLHTRSIVVRLIKADGGVASDVKSRQKVRVGTWWLFEPWRLHRSSCNWREEDTSRHFSPSRG